MIRRYRSQMDNPSFASNPDAVGQLQVIMMAII